jgi:hypothetical protein
MNHLKRSTTVLQMVKGIFTFNMQNKLSIEELEKKYNVRILPVKIIGGRRWEFAGKSIGEIPAGETKRIQISAVSGVIVYNWHVLDSKSKSELIDIIMDSIKN